MRLVRNWTKPRTAGRLALKLALSALIGASIMSLFSQMSWQYQRRRQCGSWRSKRDRFSADTCHKTCSEMKLNLRRFPGTRAAAPWQVQVPLPLSHAPPLSKFSHYLIGGQHLSSDYLWTPQSTLGWHRLVLPPLHFSCHSLVLTSLFTQANFVFPLLRQESEDCAKISSQVSNSNSNLQLISRALPLPAAAASFPHSFSTQFPIACWSLSFPLSICCFSCYCCCCWVLWFINSGIWGISW